MSTDDFDRKLRESMEAARQRRQDDHRREKRRLDQDALFGRAASRELDEIFETWKADEERHAARQEADRVTALAAEQQRAQREAAVKAEINAEIAERARERRRDW